MKTQVTSSFTDKELLAEAQKYVRRGDWSTRSPQTYDAALKRPEAFFAKCIKHMDLLNCPVLLEQDAKVW